MRTTFVKLDGRYENVLSDDEALSVRLSHRNNFTKFRQRSAPALLFRNKTWLAV